MQKHTIEKRFNSITARAVDFGDGLIKGISPTFFVEQLCQKTNSEAIRIDILFWSKNLNREQFHELTNFFIDTHKETLNILFEQYIRDDIKEITAGVSSIKT